MKKITKFKYIYDFGDWWEHSVELIRVIDDYDSEYPRVLKFKQICPPEDCGGIYGYYDFLEKYTNKEDPEHDSMVEWAEAQYYDNEYDIEAVNEDLKTALDDDFGFMNDLF